MLTEGKNLDISTKERKFIISKTNKLNLNKMKTVKLQLGDYLTKTTNGWVAFSHKTQTNFAVTAKEADQYGKKLFSQYTSGKLFKSEKSVYVVTSLPEAANIF